jgi:hypothetical protein
MVINAYALVFVCLKSIELILIKSFLKYDIFAKKNYTQVIEHLEVPKGRRIESQNHISVKDNRIDTPFSQTVYKLKEGEYRFNTRIKRPGVS